MEFRLLYDGKLLSEKCKDKGQINVGAVGRASEKHRIRKYFHHQLKELWNVHPGLSSQSAEYYTRHTTPDNLDSYPGPGVTRIVPAMPSNPYAKTWLEWVAGDHVVINGNRFVPLVSKAGGFSCSLDILFLRRDGGSGPVKNGGDIDNRLKVLFDGLRMPIKQAELGGCKIEPDEDPFFVLLEDDSLITSVSVTTDRLIIPKRADEHPDEVRLVIHVTVVNPISLFAGGRLV